MEPSWGDAPPPLPEQIAEITFDRTRCTESCRSTRIVLRRDGHVELTHLTGRREDSLFTATIDSMSFRALASRLVLDSLFQGRGADPGVLEPFATSGTVLSASIICRRFVDQWDERRLAPGTRGARLIAAVDSVTRLLSWGGMLRGLSRSCRFAARSAIVSWRGPGMAPDRVDSEMIEVVLRRYGDFFAAFEAM